MKKIAGFLVAVFMLVAGTAGATMWTSSSGVSPDGDEYTITAADGITQVLVRAYSTKTAGSQSGTFSSTAIVKTFPGTEGFGIDNKLTGQDTGETTFPEWGVDNLQLYDLLVFELPKDGMTLDALSLGWVDEGADVSVFFGGNGLGAGYDFINACFTGCGNALSPNPNTVPGTTLSSFNGNPLKGFSQVNISNAAVNSNILTGLTPPPTNTGRYVAVSGSLITSPGNDKFKVNMISASTAPTPGTLALLGLALVGMGSLRRRQAVAA